MTPEAFRELAQLAYAKAAEFQARGLIHAHAVMRLDGPTGPDSAPMVGLDAQGLSACIRQAAQAVRLVVQPAGYPPVELRWGAKLDTRVIAMGAGRDDVDGALPRPRWPAAFGTNTFLTRTDAVRWLSVVESDLLRGTWIDPAAGRVLLRVYAERWIDERPGLAPRTVELYRSLLRCHITSKLGDLALSDVTPARVRSWRKELLDGGASAVTVAKAYRLLKAVLNTAVDDELIRRNPCRIKGAGTEPSPERPTITVEQVYAIAQELRPWFRALVLLAAFTGLRWGELLALRRRHLDLDDGIVHVRASLGEVGGQLVEGPPKSAAGRRDVAILEAIVPEPRAHLDEWAEEGAGGRVFVGPQRATPRRGNFQVTWSKAVRKAGVPGLHFHDLRDTGNTLAAEGASLRELMARMGHSSARAALIYQHATRDRERAIGAAISARIEAARPQARDTIGTRRSTRAGGRRRREGGDGRPDLA